MLCVLVLYINGGTYSLKSAPNDTFVEKFFYGNFIYFQCFYQKTYKKQSPKKYFSVFRFDRNV